MPRRIVVVGGGAAGIGAAGAAKQTDPQAEVTVFTEFEDVGYSPCGIPYVTNSFPRSLVSPRLVPIQIAPVASS